MFNPDFYPTPDEVIDRMLYGIDLTGKVVLEPSAGKGNIVDYLKAHGAKEVIAAEKNDDLRTIVAGKCRIIGKDFFNLTAIDVSHVDIIVMNPPFSADEKHILHAFDIAPPGCKIFALCNWNTIEYNYHRRERRQLNQIIEEHGEKEDFGNCFSTAERESNVEVGFVKLTKPGKEQQNEFEGFFMEEEPEDAGQVGIMPYNFVRELVNRYIAAIKLFDEQIELGIKMTALTSGFFDGKASFTCTEDGKPKMRQDYAKDLQKAAWEWVLSKMKMEKYTTQGLKSDINRFVEQQTKIPFTMKNIYKMIEIVIGTTAGRMDKAIIEVFDYLTERTAENRYNVPGWKTNSHFLIGKKFIMDWMVEDRGYSQAGKMNLRYNSNIDRIKDLDKAMCYILGHNYDEHRGIQSVFWSFDRSGQGLEFGKWYSGGFFNFKGYKKGTMHFEFQNEDDWARLNQEIARIKGYPLFEHKTQTAYQKRNTG